MSNENTPIIRKIRTSEDENAGTQYNIGTFAEYVDYNDSTVAQAIENLEEEVNRLSQEVDNQTAQITEMDQTFGTAKKVINKINKFQNVVDELPQDIEHQVQRNINRTKFYTKDILWQDNLERTLRSVLGNLINLPLQATNLRDWIEKISARGDNDGGGDGGSGGGGIPTFIKGAKWEVGSNTGIPISGAGYTFNYANGYDASGDFSFQVHFKFNSFAVTGSGGTAGEEQRSGIVCKHSGNPPGSGAGYAVYGIRYPRAATPVAGYHMRIGASSIIGIGELNVDDTSGEHDIAVVVTGGKIYGYVDGELESTNDFSGNDISRGQILRLGTPIASWFPYDSTVYSFLGYDRALTAEEVAQNADAGFKLATPYTTICPDGDAGFWALSGSMSCIMCGSIAGTGEENGNNYTIGYSIGKSEGTITLSARLKANGFSTLPLGTEQRLKAINVIDNVNILTGEVIYNNSVGSHTFDGTENITKSGNRYLYRACNDTTGITNNDVCCYCPTMPEKTAQDIYSNRNTENYVGIGFNTDGNIVMVDNTQSWASVDEFKAYLAQLDPPLTVYYASERLTETLTPAPEILLKAGNNNCDYTTNPPGYLIITGNVKERQ